MNHDDAGEGSALIYVLMSAVNAVLALWLARQARARGYSFWFWLVISFSTGGLCSLVLLLLPDRTAQRKRERLIEEMTRRVPPLVSIAASTHAPPPSTANASLGDQYTQ